MTHRSAAVASLILAAVLTPIVAAQQPTPPTVKQSAPTPAAGSSPFGGTSREAKTFDVTFGGGTLEQYIETLRAASKDEPVNVMLSEDVREVRIPRLNLKGVSVFTAVGALERINVNGGGFLQVTDFRNEGNDVIYSIRANKSGVVQQPGGTPGSRLVVSVSNLVPNDLDAAKREERLTVILSAMESALRLGRTGDADEPNIALHKESGLLMVLGSQEDRQTVVSVLNEMQSTWRGVDPQRDKTIDVTAASAQEVARAIREAIPESDRNGVRNLYVLVESPTRLVLKGAQSDILRAQGIVAYVDRARVEPTEVLQMRDKLASREKMFQEELAMFRGRQSALEAQADDLRSRIAGTEPQLAAAKAREETLLREISDLRTRLREAETRIVELAREKNAGKP